MTRILSALLCLALCIALVVCGSAAAADDGAADTGRTETQTEAALLAAEAEAEADVETTGTITLSDGASSAEGGGVLIVGNTVTITAGGSYRVTGTLTDGQIVVNAPEEKVVLALDGASVTCESSAALYVVKAKKVILSLVSGSENSLASTGEYIQTDDNTVDAAIFSKDDLTIKGSGSAGTGGTLNIGGNNAALENVDYQGDGNIAITVSTGSKNSGTTFKKVKITKAFRGIQFWSLSGDSVIDDCVLDVAGYTFNIDAAVAGSTLTIKDSTLNGWTSYTSGIKLVSFDNCKLGLNAYQYLRPYSETKLTDCEFTSAGYQLNAGGSDAYTITLTNCTKNGTPITAENVKALLLDTDDWNTNATLIVNGVTVTL